MHAYVFGILPTSTWWAAPLGWALIADGIFHILTTMVAIMDSAERAILAVFRLIALTVAAVTAHIDAGLAVVLRPPKRSAASSIPSRIPLVILIRRPFVLK